MVTVQVMTSGTANLANLTVYCGTDWSVVLVEKTLKLEMFIK